MEHCTHQQTNRRFGQVYCVRYWNILLVVEEAGGKCLPCAVDIRDDGAISKAVQDAVKKFGGIDILVNNASAISLTGTSDTTTKK